MPSSRVSLPPHAPGMRIGLFGGTFDPPHEAHLGACLIAMKRLGLDRVWWLVTPGNPLKNTRGLAPLAERIRGRQGTRAPSPHRRHRRRGADRHPVHLRDRRLSAPPLSGRALRLDHGGRQSAQLSPLAEMAWDRCHGTDRGDRPSRTRASTPVRAPRARRWRAPASRRRRRSRWRTASRRRGFTSTD